MLRMLYAKQFWEGHLSKRLETGFLKLILTFQFLSYGC
ncbi:hypothetical protein PCC9214_04621 [Planktothrix tepida]|uniref:Uncharacterized protein n=1 Tax=Planktothrix pseudagardhii TaxID=132604 RepID=A0A9W4G3W8_9CYAN|nr:hypothetical protein NO713_00825 [Planktothrix pseudagardhii]CAD5980212.1 hypothetical protein PCC9214_04621 [Planktothrix tepida]